MPFLTIYSSWLSFLIVLENTNTHWALSPRPFNLLSVFRITWEPRNPIDRQAKQKRLRKKNEVEQMEYEWFSYKSTNLFSIRPRPNIFVLFVILVEKTPKNSCIFSQFYIYSPQKCKTILFLVLFLAPKPSRQGNAKHR